MKWKTMRKITAEREMSEMDVSAVLAGTLPEIPSEYTDLRNQIHTAWNHAQKSILEAIDNKRSYLRDVDFAFGLYHIFQHGMYTMTVRQAANVDIWRYISMRVAPDILLERWKKKSSWPDRFYKKPNRIYFRSLWWYLYLSKQDNEDETWQVMKQNNSDTIAQLVERAGTHGYCPELYRKIIYRNYRYYALEHGKDKNIFRKVMKLHTARVAVIEPELVSGGMSGYVEGLYKYFEDK